jgi:hypothetical protein
MGQLRNVHGAGNLSKNYVAKDFEIFTLSDHISCTPI